MPSSHSQNTQNFSISYLFNLGEQFIKKLPTEQAQDYVLLKNHELAMYWTQYHTTEDENTRKCLYDKIQELKTWGRSREYTYLGKKINVASYHTKTLFLVKPHISANSTFSEFAEKYEISSKNFYVINLFCMYGIVKKDIATSVISTMHNFYQDFSKVYYKDRIVFLLLGCINQLKISVQDSQQFLANYFTVLSYIQYWWPLVKEQSEHLFCSSSLKDINFRINYYKALCFQRLKLENSNRMQVFMEKSSLFDETNIVMFLEEIFEIYGVSLMQLLDSQLSNIRESFSEHTSIKEHDERLNQLLKYSLIDLHEYFWAPHWRNSKSKMPVNKNNFMQQSPCVSPKSSCSNLKKPVGHLEESHQPMTCQFFSAQNFQKITTDMNMLTLRLKP